MELRNVSALAEFLEVAEDTIRRWIRTGRLQATKRQKGYEVHDTPRNSEFILARLREKWSRPQRPHVPEEIRSYDEWHQLLDELCWLVKVCYSNRDSIKSRRFRQDELLYNYLCHHKIDLRTVNREFKDNPPRKLLLITDDLKRGWYNELAYCSPLRKSTLGLSFNDVELNEDSSMRRFAFPSWRIISSYYAIYFYLRSATLHKFDGFRLQEHGATISSFKYNALPSLRRCVWKFPFDISYTRGERVARRSILNGKLSDLSFNYCRHPREPLRTPVQIFEAIRRTFKRIVNRRGSRSPYTLFDYLHDFRVWANYLDIDNLLNLRGSGYKSLLDQNLALVLFFIASFAEILYIARFGEGRYVQQLELFYGLVCGSDPAQEQQFHYSPIYQRSQVFHHAGLLSSSVALGKSVDMNLVRLRGQPTKEVFSP